MEAIAEGLWELADHHEKTGKIGEAIKCLEAICQSKVSFLPNVEVKTRLRVASILLKHSHNTNHAKAHLERAQPLLKSIPSCFELKCRACSLLSQCYHLAGTTASQKQVLNKGLELTATSVDGMSIHDAKKDAFLNADVKRHPWTDDNLQKVEENTCPIKQRVRVLTYDTHSELG